MKKKNTAIEFQTMFHITFIAVISLLGFLLICVALISHWTFCYAVSGGIGIVLLVCWVVHFAQWGSAEERVWFYTCVSLVGVLYYGAQTVAVTDVPIVICLFIIILSATEDIRLIYLMTLSYPVVVLWNIFVTGYIGRDTDQLVLLRIVLGVACLGCADLVSSFFIRQQKRGSSMHKRMEEELRQAKHENERFLTNVSHELRTPINAVNGMSEIILHREELADSLKEDVQSIQDAGRRLFGQVSDILDYSELITGTLVVSDDNYEIISVINDAVSDVQWKRMNGKLDVAVDIQTDLPRVMRGDAVKIKKIIVALLDNAIKFTERGGAYMYIGKRDEDYGINLNIDLWDTGVGMSDEQLDRLFFHFYKGDSDVERKTGGLGLGLAIVHGMVSAMGGFVSIDSREGEGTHVHVSIPQQVVDKQASLSVDGNRIFQIACYFNREKYVRREIADYYYTMVAHIRESFGLHIREADSLAALKKIVEQEKLTHVFIANWEYEMDTAYFEELGKRLCMVVFADGSFSLPAQSSVRILRKPVYLMSVVNLLNATKPGAMAVQHEEQLAFSDVKVLVVDDDSMNLTVAKGVLKTYGITAETCLSGQAALEKCMLEDYQIIFMDHMMPGMNGIAAMKQIRELRHGHYRKIPIVALTANAVSGAREMFLGEGFDEFISKPIELSAMSRILRKFLTGREETDES